MRIVIIGNSATAVGAVESIRQHDQTAEVLIISEEPHMIYSRPLLSHYLAGEIDRSRLAYRGADFYIKHHVTAVLEDRVIAIEPDAHRVHTASGAEYTYDKLLIATGGQPIVPPTPGQGLEGVFTMTRLSDAERLLIYLRTHTVRHVVVVGGGMIGMKVTEALVKRGLGVTMVELAPLILSAALDRTASHMMTGLLQQGGVNIYTENSVAEIGAQDGHVAGVALKDGQVLPCDSVIFGVGVRPNADLARQAGLRVNRGIVVDEYMRTSAPDLYAAGDVAEAYDLVVDMNRTVAIWPNAYRQGAIAGAHMVGVSRPDKGGIAMNTVEAMGVPAMSIGYGNAPEGEYEVVADLDASRHTYRRLVLKENRLIGAILVGQIDRAGIYTGLIRNRIDISEHRRNLLSGHLSLLSLPDQYRKHVVRGVGIEV